MQTGGPGRTPHNLACDYEIVSPSERVAVGPLATSGASAGPRGWSSPAQGLLQAIDKYPREQRSFRILARRKRNHQQFFLGIVFYN